MLVEFVLKKIKSIYLITISSRFRRDYLEIRRSEKLSKLFYGAYRVKVSKKYPGFLSAGARKPGEK